MNRLYLIGLIICLSFVARTSLAQEAGSKPQFAKPRIIVTTDITNEPDDQESLVRFLLYSNQVDIEGLIGSTGVWKVSDPATHVIHECIDAYGKVHANLLLHDKNYPTAEFLHKITATGNRAYGMSDVGFRPSKGAKMIIEAVDKDDPRPVWVLAWGGSNNIAQAIWTVRQERSAEELKQFLSKMRVYELAGQDDCGAWMAKTFPDLFLIRNYVAFKGMSIRFSNNRNPHARGGDESVVSKKWVRENIQENHGPMGEVYPDALHIWEGDTPTFFHLLPIGLNDPQQQWQGGWGGRFGRDKTKNIAWVNQEYSGVPCELGGCWINELPYLDYWMYTDAKDKWSYKGTNYDNVYCSIFRWRTDFQHDFAARMDWCVKPYDEANHEPVVVVGGDKTTNVIYQDAQVGEVVRLDSSGTSDPDGDQLSYQWWIYNEAGTYGKETSIQNANADQAELTIPADAAGKTIHVILTVRDDGQPTLTRYRRVVLSCSEKSDNSADNSE